MIGSHWYHKLFTIYSKVFANLFNDITVARYDSSGNVVQQLPVPIAFGPKSKWIRRITEDSDHDQTIAYQVPRMAYELTSWERISDGRQKWPLRKNTNVNTANTLMTYQYVENPHRLTFQLYILARNADDGFQIMEQIIPFFAPDWHVTISPVPGMNYRDDCKIKLLSASLDQDYEGSLDDQRIMTWTITFDMEVPFYGPSNRQGVIKRVQVDLYVPDGELNAQSMANSPWASRIVIKPGLDANGNPTTDANSSINYKDIDPADNWDFIEEYYEGTNLRYDLRTGKDKKV